ncbi:MAG: hypothetical protein K2Q20_01590 [Phycisphaerales bacterium]|nr:hypothetical protein [Phycisphaerales bacterium]
MLDFAHEQFGFLVDDYGFTLTEDRSGIENAYAAIRPMCYRGRFLRISLISSDRDRDLSVYIGGRFVGAATFEEVQAVISRRTLGPRRVTEPCPEMRPDGPTVREIVASAELIRTHLHDSFRHDAPIIMAARFKRRPQ